VTIVPVGSRRRESVCRLSLCLVLSLATGACGGTLDAGRDEPRGQLPVDDRNPIVLFNDGPYDNWQGEYAMLFASTGAVSLAGIVINASPVARSLDDNVAGWQQMAAAARNSGLSNIPELLGSDAPALVRPSNGSIDSTVPNDSEGARFIIDTSNRLSLPFRPLVVVTGSRLTDVADAFLIDPTLADRGVVVSSLGTTTTDGGEMGMPNGEMDTWADVIVAKKLRYVQVSSFYDQTMDVPTSLLPQLPANEFTSWIQSKQALIYDDPLAADQVGVLAVAVPSFVSAVSRVEQREAVSDNTPILSQYPTGPIWLVTQVGGALATASFWQMLLSPGTFRP
jgi:hypothetical protein